jgi:hypothetical protein
MIKLKEVLVKVLEGRCERLEGESDEDFITRCGNQGWGSDRAINHVPDKSTVMKTKVVIPIKRDNKLY